MLGRHFIVLSQCRDLTAVAESRLQREAGDTNVVAAIRSGPLLAAGSSRDLVPANGVSAPQTQRNAAQRHTLRLRLDCTCCCRSLTQSPLTLTSIQRTPTTRETFTSLLRLRFAFTHHHHNTTSIATEGVTSLSNPLDPSSMRASGAAQPNTRERTNSPADDISTCH